MASNKNQHYVPQCYLKSFSSVENNSLISLYNIKNDKLIKDVTIKDQCSKNYFYSQDLSLEHFFQEIEGIYAESLREIQNKKIISKENKWFMRCFWFIQNIRTEKYFEELYDYAKDRIKDMYDTEISNIDKKKYNKKIFEHCFNNIRMIEDLEVCIVENNTKKDFFTSDNPSVLTNRLYFSHKKVRFISFGLGSAGALFFLPLTPKLLLVIYDSDVYSISKEKGFHEIKSESDIDAINYLQVMNCNNNIYMKNSSDLECIRKMISNKKELGPSIPYSYKRYSAISKKEINDISALENGERYLELGLRKYPQPYRWSKFINWRKKGFVMVDKFSRTPVRRNSVDRFNEKDFKKITL